jgi:PAS domain S-box-containing protein
VTFLPPKKRRGAHVSWSIGKWATLGFALVLVVLVANAGFSYWNTGRLVENEQRVAHTHEVLTQLEAVLSTLKDAETGQRGFLITFEESYLKPYEDAVRRVNTTVDRLQELTAANPKQQERLPLLRQKITTKLRELKETIELRRTQGYEAARKEVLTGRGQEEMEDLRQLVADMEADEKALLRQRAETSAASYNWAVGTFLVATCLALVLVALAYDVIRRDLLGRHAAEEEMSRQREWLRVTLTSIGDGVIATDVDGRITFLNAVAALLTGWPEKEAKGRPLEEVFRIVNEGTRQPMRNPQQQVMEHGTIVGLANHTLLLNRNGDETPIDDSAAPIRGAGGKVLGVVLVFRDVRARRRAEAALRERVREIETLMEVMPIAVFVAHDPGCLRVTANRTGYDLLGAPPGANLSQAGPPEKRDVPFRVFREGRELSHAEFPMRYASARGVEVRRAELTFVLADGSAITLYGNASPLFDDRGKVRGCVAAFVDITERKRTEEALKEADRRKDEFLAMLAHELRNPLAPVRNAVQILSLRGPSEPSLQWACAVINRQVQQMARLVDDLLDVSRITRGRVRLRKAPVDLASVVAQAIETSRPLLDARKHQLTVSLPPKPVHLEADRTRLAQVLSNLLNNAAKYTEEGGRVWLTAEVSRGQGTEDRGQRTEDRGRSGREGASSRSAPEIVLRVRDTGIGISPELLPHVFDLFVQAERSIDRAQGGLGIGLTLVRRLVEMHGGAVEAHSEGPGQGSEFVVRLPILDTAAEGPGAGPKPEDGHAGSAKPLRILVVDDNKDAAESLAVLASLWGHEVRTATDGPEALRIAEAFRPAVVLLDIGLPGMDGYEVARRLRQLPNLENAFVIAVTGYSQEEDRRRSREAGFDHHVVKPADADTLQALLRRGHSESRS